MLQKIMSLCRTFYEKPFARKESFLILKCACRSGDIISRIPHDLSKVQ